MYRTCNYEHAVVATSPQIAVYPLRIHGEGLIASSLDWEHYSFAHPGASVIEFL